MGLVPCFSTETTGIATANSDQLSASPKIKFLAFKFHANTTSHTNAMRLHASCAKWRLAYDGGATDSMPTRFYHSDYVRSTVDLTPFKEVAPI